MQSWLIKATKESCLIGVIALVFTGVYTLIVGLPQRGVICEQDQQEPPFVCLDYAQSSWGENIYWIDARSRSDWEKNGVSGSVLLTDDPKEDFMELFAQEAEGIFLAAQSGKKLLIYCNAKTCGSSKFVRQQILDQGLHDEVYILYGGYKSFQ